MINALDAYIFTDYRQNTGRHVDVYQEQWMIDACKRLHKPESLIIGMSGDKGQAAELLKKPVVFFGDHEANAVQVLKARQGNDAYVVRIGNKKEEPVRDMGGHFFTVTRKPNEWIELCKNFSWRWALPQTQDAVFGMQCNFNNSGEMC